MISAALSIFLQLCMAAFVAAAPIDADETMTTAGVTPWQYGTGGGIIGLIVLILDIIVWIEVLKSNRPPMEKLIWCLVVFLFPIVGMIIYFIFSNRKAHNTYEPLP